MARIRTVKPQFFLNEELAELPAMTRLLFIGLWTQADRDGRLLDRPKRLKAEIFPYDNYDIEKGLNQLCDAKFIIRYKSNINTTGSVLDPEQPTTELALIQILTFHKHQKIDKVNEKDGELPAPISLDYLKSITRLPKVEEGKGKEGKGKEGKGSEACGEEKIENEGFKKLCDWIKDKSPRVLELREQLTEAQYQTLITNYTKQQIADGLIEMHNWKPLLTKKVSAYRTLLSFIKNQKRDAA
jgi:hypothetical protein